MSYSKQQQVHRILIPTSTCTLILCLTAAAAGLVLWMAASPSDIWSSSSAGLLKLLKEERYHRPSLMGQLDTTRGADQGDGQSNRESYSKTKFDGMEKAADVTRDDDSDGTEQAINGRNNDDVGRGDCEGRPRVYMYELPREYNEELTERCQAGKEGCKDQAWDCLFCGKLDNQGLGPRVPAFRNDSSNSTRISPVPPHAWFRTHQFSLEVIFHNSMKRYPCLTNDPARAQAFYIPYYAGQDAALSLLCNQLQLRDRRLQRLLGWLSAQTTWRSTGGRAHFMVLGRQPNDLSRPEGLNTWGMPVTSQPDLANVTILWWEKGFRRGIREMGVPYPTSFHPTSDEDLAIWQETIRHAKREWLVMFLGSAKRQFSRQSTSEVRQELMRQCQESPSLCLAQECVLWGEGLPCEMEPEVVTREFSRAVFCLQPEGDTPTRKSLFDSIVAGCVPVLFTNQSAHDQYVGYLPTQAEDRYAVVLPQECVTQQHVNVVQLLSQIPTSRVAAMRETLVSDILPRIIYNSPGASTSYLDAMQFALRLFLNNDHGSRTR